MEYEWDPAEEAANQAKHGISFVAARPGSREWHDVPDAVDRGDKPRWVAIGRHPEIKRSSQWFTRCVKVIQDHLGTEGAIQ